MHTIVNFQLLIRAAVVAFVLGFATIAASEPQVLDDPQQLDSPDKWRQLLLKDSSVNSAQTRSIGIGIGGSATAMPSPVIDLRILFALNSSDIEARWHDALQALSTLLQQEPNLALLIEGHTDAYGSQATNERLSSERAIAVKYFLAGKDAATSPRLSAVGRGANAPLYADRFDPRNRRVSFSVVTANAADSQTDSSDSAKPQLSTPPNALPELPVPPAPSPKNKMSAEDVQALLKQLQGGLKKGKDIKSLSTQLAKQLKQQQETFAVIGQQAARVMEDLALLRRAATDDEALRIAEDLLENKRKALGTQHREVQDFLLSLAGVYMQRGNADKLLALYQRNYEILRQILGSDKQETLKALLDLAQCNIVMVSKLKVDREAFGKAQLYQATNAYEKFSDSAKREDIATNVYGSLIYEIAMTYKRIGDYPTSRYYFAKLLSLVESAKGVDAIETKGAESLLADAYALIPAEAISKAIPLYQNKLSEFDERIAAAKVSNTNLNGEQSLLPVKMERAMLLGKMAGVYAKDQQYAKALDFYRKALTGDIPLSLMQSDQQFLISAAIMPKGTESVMSMSVVKDAALSFIAKHFSKDETAVRFAYELVLKDKGSVLEKERVSHLDGEGKPALGQKYANDTGGDHSIESQLKMVDKQIKQLMPVTISKGETQVITIENVAKALPKDSVFVDFVTLNNLDELSSHYKKHNPFTGKDRGVRFDAYYLVFVLTSGNQITLTDLGYGVQLNAKIEKMMTAITDPKAQQDPASENTIKTLLAEIYSLVLKPLESRFAPDKNLIISPDGDLNRLPFAAMITGEGNYLIEKHKLNYVSSARDLLHTSSAKPPALELALLAAPAYDEKLQQTGGGNYSAVRARDFSKMFQPLPGTLNEMQDIPPLVKGKQLVLQGSEATESALRQLNSPRILHLATHGFFLSDEIARGIGLDNDPALFALSGLDQTVARARAKHSAAEFSPMVRSGLAFAGANHAKEVSSGDDGILTALEASELNLQGTDLVVLSACETGVGLARMGEGIYGLRRAFVLAGAKNLVMSLWVVEDDITAAQMREFYRHYASGELPADALRVAQLQTIAKLREKAGGVADDSFMPSVRRWAPFIAQTSVF
ncbi:MAG: CHAT domain-containing protein [Methyloglobulus sp.]|nr:CHAT domain-containing protein [Methyloglobulus sp.]